MKHNFFIILIPLIFITCVSSCKKNSTPASSGINTITSDSIYVNFNTDTTFTFFSFKNNAVVPNSDSNSANWDFGLRLTTFLINSHASGPGDAGVIIQQGLYDNITTAPASGYAYDSSSSQLAIKDGSWYNYDINSHNFIPTAGLTFIFRTADDHYAKMVLLSVGYLPFTGPTPVTLIYRFRYTYQANGTAFN